MRIVAFYLPQYHRIPENDAWWGPGFTEWTNVRKARPLFPGHFQPRSPMGERYYDLLSPDARAWQAEIAARHGVGAFCYYHYWFNGKRLLERPFEEVLRSQRPEFPFALAWANEPWTRVWNGRRRDVLMPEAYGGPSDWEAHFADLLPAFEDPRYLRVDGRPLFLIYRAGRIPRRTEMIARWRALAKEHGLNGLHLLQVLNTFEGREETGFDGAVELEPMFTLAHDLPIRARLSRYARALRRAIRPSRENPPKGALDIIDSNAIWERILARDPRRTASRRYLGAFHGWDNSARRGSRGTIFCGETPELLRQHLTRQLERARDLAGTDLVFFNAWNEWGEGAYLEPDARQGMGPLEAVRDSVAAFHAAPLSAVTPAPSLNPRPRPSV